MGILQLVPIALPFLPYPRSHQNQKQRDALTLHYGSERSQYERVIGSQFWVELAELWKSDRVEAIACTLPPDVPFVPTDAWEGFKPVPHFTLSWVDGAAPVEAIALLRGLHPGISKQRVGDRALCQIEFLEWK